MAYVVALAAGSFIPFFPAATFGGVALDLFFPDQLGLDSIAKQKPNETVTKM